MVRQQIDFTRTFDGRVRRITVLIRAADLLWPFQQDRARSTFAEAFDVAEQHETESGRNGASVPIATPDQRYVVIRAVAKRDATWAKKLTEKMLKIDSEREDRPTIRDSANDVLTAEQLLDSATRLIPIDLDAALDLARRSLNYPASYMITRFLYRLAQVSPQTADQFYDQALMTYADRPMREFLYLTTYPFAFLDSGDTPGFGYYSDVLPNEFVTNKSLQRRFVLTLLGRAQAALESPLDEGDNFNGLPGIAHILQVLIRIEPVVKLAQPDLLTQTIQAREKALVSLPTEIQNILQPLASNRSSYSSPQTFSQRVETAEKTSNSNQRDDLIVEAILSSSDDDPLAALLSAIDQITDINMHGPLTEWLYFRRAKEAVIRNEFDEAERLASKVQGSEQRAFLLMEIARGLLKKGNAEMVAREVLDESIAEAKKSGKTIFAARTLLAASNLYARIEVNRSISVLGDAVNAINRLEDADFYSADQALVIKLKRRSNPGGRFLLRFPMQGVNPEMAFREMAKLDFDSALSQTTALTDKFLRSTTTLGIADLCLQRGSQERRDKSEKPAKPGN